MTTESFRFQDEKDYEYEIFSIVGSARAWRSVILAGKRGSRRHSTRVLARMSLWRQQVIILFSFSFIGLFRYLQFYFLTVHK